MQIWPCWVGLTPLQSLCPRSLLVIPKTCLSETHSLLILSQDWLPQQRRPCLLVTLTCYPLLPVEMIPWLGKRTVVVAQLALWGSRGATWTSQAHPAYKLLCLVTHAQDEEWACNGYQMGVCVFKQRHILDNQKQRSGSLYIKPQFNNSACSLTEKKQGRGPFMLPWLHKSPLLPGMSTYRGGICRSITFTASF